MILIADGRIGLDQPVGEVLPALKSMKVATDVKTGLDGRPAQTAITMRHLMTHTAGLSYQFYPGSKLSEAYLARGITPVQRTARTGPGHPQVRDLTQMIERLADLPLVAEPGTNGIIRSARRDGPVIETVTGKRFDVFLKDRVFAPLGMATPAFSHAERLGRFRDELPHDAERP